MLGDSFPNYACKRGELYLYGGEILCAVGINFFGCGILLALAVASVLVSILDAESAAERNELKELDETQQTHAEKQVQMTAELADQRVQRHRGRLLGHRVRQRVVVQSKADCIAHNSVSVSIVVCFVQHS